MVLSSILNKRPYHVLKNQQSLFLLNDKKRFRKSLKTITEKKIKFFLGARKNTSNYQSCCPS